MNSALSLLQLEERIQKETDKTIKYVLLHALARRFVKEEKLDKALQIYSDALNIAEYMNDPKLECETLIHLGDIAVELNNTNSSSYEYMAHVLKQIDLAEYFYNKA